MFTTRENNEVSTFAEKQPQATVSKVEKQCTSSRSWKRPRLNVSETRLRSRRLLWLALMVNLSHGIPWCSGYHICLTRRRSPVRSWAESCFAPSSRVNAFLFLIGNPHTAVHSALPTQEALVLLIRRNVNVAEAVRGEVCTHLFFGRGISDQRIS